MKPSIWTNRTLLLATGICLVFAYSMSAQVQTQTTTTKGTPTREVQIESGEVVAIIGDDLFVKMADGTLRDYPDVPANAKVTVDGKQLGINELEPGMKLQRTTVTTTTPQVVTTIESISGKVLKVNPPFSVTLALENGESQMFKIPEGQKFTVDGQETDALGLREGMKITATKIVETPVTSVSEQTRVTGTVPKTLPVLILIVK